LKADYMAEYDASNYPAMIILSADAKNYALQIKRRRARCCRVRGVNGAGLKSETKNIALFLKTNTRNI